MTPSESTGLKAQVYPGRVIILGRDRSDEHVIVAYAVTGRSPSSQARKIELEGNCALVRPTDEEILRKGDPELLIYPAICIGGGIAVSNGKQSKDVCDFLTRGGTPIQVLEASLQTWDYEPDSPNFTPRISGCVLGVDRGALSILKRAEDGRTHRQYFDFPLIPGKGYRIATYKGENQDPLPSFEGEPQMVELSGKTAQETVTAVYESLGSDTSDMDFRVAAVCVFSRDPQGGAFDFAVINRHEKEARNNG
jgi:IMP cyclohydrolase